MKKVAVLADLLIAAVCCVSLIPSVKTQASEYSYTYTYDYFGILQESPDAYTVSEYITGADYECGDFKDPEGMFAADDAVYIADTGNNRIVVFDITGGTLSYDRVIDGFDNNGTSDTLSGPMDIYVSEAGNMYICDTNNLRIVEMDREGKLLNLYTQPQDETYDASQSFMPVKCVADRAGRVICQAQNINEGLMEFSPDGSFIGYIGANEVKYSMIDYIWKLISTKAQRAQMAQFVPTEYDNLAMDSKGFIYVTTSTFDEWDLMDDQAKPIRKLNSLGDDILIKNGRWYPIGDIDWGNAGGISGPSKLVDITALDNGTYYALDKTRGRIFAYDEQGDLLYAFGGVGNTKGSFQLPAAIDHSGNELYILDSRAASVTHFTLTEYGKFINSALSEYENGNYDASSTYWKQVLKLNGNYDLAYIGIGRAQLRQGNYKAAMKNFKLKYDKKNYSKAFQLYRKQWIEKNLGRGVAIIIALLLISSIIKFIKKVKKEALEA